MAKTPAALGYRMPAEWEPHEATWLAWPHNRDDWPGKFAPIPWVYCEIIRHIVGGERVRLIISSISMENEARRMLRRSGIDLDSVDFVHIRTDRSWTRDTGPIFLVSRANSTAGTRASLPARARKGIVDFHFNAWAKYRDYNFDSQTPRIVASGHTQAGSLRSDVQFFDAQHAGSPFRVEGGAIDVNGQGTLMTTEECMLDAEIQPRNPGLSKNEIETALRDNLGVTNVLWLGRGIAGDDTHGHIDDLCRFVAPDTVVLCRETNETDENFDALEDNRERLKDLRLENGGRINVIDLPMPAPLYFDGRRLPASYANFYIANSAVLVPTFNDPNDRLALGILSELFPKRKVVGIHCVDLVWGLGTIHCMTQQEPAI